MSAQKNQTVNQQEIEELVKKLKDRSIRKRREAAVALSEIASKDIDSLRPYIPDFVMTLDYPEAHTRWECVGILTRMLAVAPNECMAALDGVQRSLIEEANSRLTLACFLFLCRAGATSAANSKKVWPYLKDDIETFDGDVYYDRILAYTREFAAGNISKDVKKDLAELMKFDAENDRGSMGRRAKAIIAALNKKKTASTKATKKPKTAQSKKPATKKPASTKTVSKKTEPKKTTEKKSSTKKVATEKNTTKKTKAKKPASKKETVKKETGKKEATSKKKKKTTSKKTETKKQEKNKKSK